MVTHRTISAGSCMTRVTTWWSRASVCASITRFSTAHSCSLDHRTTTSGTSIRCAFGRVTVNERVSPGRMGRSPERGLPVQGRFHAVTWPWNGRALYETEQCPGKRRKRRIEKGIGAHSKRGLRKPQGGTWVMVVLIGRNVPESCVRGWHEEKSTWLIAYSTNARGSVGYSCLCSCSEYLV